MSSETKELIRDRILPKGKTEIPLNSIPKEWRKYAGLARDEGWVIFSNGRGKQEWRGPRGQRLVLPSTPSVRGNTMKNYKMQMKRAGVPGF